MNGDSGSGMAPAPLGAGDLIDRAVRFYRKFFWTLVLIAAPPVIVGTLISVGWTIVGREIFSIGASKYSAENIFYGLFLWFGSVVIWLTETIATLVVMGGASRNFVRHLLFEEPITFAETYRSTWTRLAGLISASTLIALLLGFIGLVIFYFGLTVVALAIILIASVFESIPFVAFIISLVVGVVGTGGTVCLFFLIAVRFAFIPQAMLVEGQGVFAALARSATLGGGGNWRRLAALFFFTTLAAYSALALLYVPLAWYASANGVQLMTFDADLIPAWYEIAYNLIWQVSFILLSPVWMVGLCLLYVDERVRREGYDIELMAARRLGDIPAVPATYVNPLTPALSATAAATIPDGPERPSPFTTLGLK